MTNKINTQSLDEEDRLESSLLCFLFGHRTITVKIPFDQHAYTTKTYCRWCWRTKP